MVIYLFSDKKYEYQAHACLRSLEHKITDDIKVVYFTVGFDSDINTKNLTKVWIPINPVYPKLMYYKPELALKLLDMFPDEHDFVFTDVDILFTHRMDFKQFTHTYEYPLAIYLTHEFPFQYKKENNETIYINEETLMDYFNVKKRSMRYQGSGFFSFNRQCIDFLKEWTSICKNQYLLENEETYFPFSDETAMNVCLWKRNATQSLGHIFVNTLKFDTIKLIEENTFYYTFLGNNIDDYGSDTEYVHEPEKIMFYHGIKDNIELQKSLNYLLTNSSMKDKLIHHYSTTQKLIQSGGFYPLKKPTPIIQYNNINGAFIEINGELDTQYRVNFINKRDNSIVYSTVIGNNCWAKASLEYYVDWKIEVHDLRSTDRYEYNLSLKNKRVYIVIDSKSLGDTLAWIPYVEEFRKKHDCEMICSTFWNTMFKNEYPSITFIEPGTDVYNLYAQYIVGMFYNYDDTINYNKIPLHPLNKPLQQWASEILGIDYVETRPRVSQPSTTTINPKLITIGVHSTAQAKYWNNSNGWQDVVNWLVERGYEVKLLSKEHDGYMGNYNPTGVTQHSESTIESVIEQLKMSKLFIGISSGLSWLSWAVGTPTVIISGFSESYAEMKECMRITAPKTSCSGCFNRVRLNPNDWHWCPDHKNTHRQYECSRNITSEMVIKELQKLL